MSKTDRIACNLKALSAAEQSRRAQAAAVVFRAAPHVSELADGYEIAVEADEKLNEELELLIELERKCCSFLQFEINQGQEQITVRITGPEGTKPFLASEFGLTER